MGTTIETGTNYGQYTTSKFRFSKAPAEITEGVGAAISDSVTFGSAPAAPAPVTPSAPQNQRFRDLDPASRGFYRDTVKDLAGNGRLFVRDDNGLRRADPMEVKERLDNGQPVEVVTRVASESRFDSNAHSSGASKSRGVFTSGWNIADSNRSSSSSERVYYTSSPVTQWDSLDFASEGAGVKGVATLPASGQSVVVSSSYESEWNRRASEQWGIFTEKETHSSAGGYTRRNTQAD